jgi:hypothetical protein
MDDQSNTGGAAGAPTSPPSQSAIAAAAASQLLTAEANVVLSHNHLGEFEVPVDLFLQMIFAAFVRPKAAS